MLLDSQSLNHFNDLQLSREARKRSPRKKPIHSLLKSYNNKFSNYIDKNPGQPKKVTFLPSPERGTVEKFSPNKRSAVSMAADSGMFGSPPSSNENSTHFDEEPSLILAIVRMVNGTAAKCLKVKLMVNMQQFQDLRTDPKRLKNFKIKLQPLMIDLLPAEDRFKPWKIDSIEPCGIEISSDSPRPKNVTHGGTTKEKPPSRIKRSIKKENYFEPFNGEGVQDFSQASSPCQLNKTFCGSKKTRSDEQIIPEAESINNPHAVDLKRPYNLEQSPLDINITAGSNSEFIVREVSENVDVCSDQDLFALLYNDDDQAVIKNENFNVKEEYSDAEKILHPNELPNHFRDREISKVEVATETFNTTTQNDGSKFDLGELLDQWDEESRFINRIKTSEKLNEASEFNSPENHAALEQNVSPTTSTVNAEIVPPNSAKKCHSPIVECPTSNLQSNSRLTQKKSEQLGPCAVDNSNWNYNDTFKEDFHLKHELDDLRYADTICNTRSKNNVTSPNNNECLNKFNNYRSQSLVKTSCLSSENSDENIINPFDEKRINSSADENNTLAHQPTDIRCSALSVSSAQKIIAPSKFNNGDTFPTKSSSLLHSPTSSSLQLTYSHSEKLGSLSSHAPEPIVHSFSPPNIQSSSVSNGPTDCCKDVTPNPFPKLEPFFQGSNSTVQNSSLTVEPTLQSRRSLGETIQQMKPAYHSSELIKNEIILRDPCFHSENSEPVISSRDVSLVTEAKNKEFGSSISSKAVKNIASQDSSVHSPVKPTTPLSFNRKPNCSILMSSRLKSLSKNKSTALIATGKPIPKRKDIPFLMKGKLKRVKLS